MSTLKKFVTTVLAAVLVISLAACGSEPAPEKESSTEAKSEANQGSSSEAPKEAGMTGVINVVSREEGSGTRGAFTEITGIVQDKKDMTKADAAIQNSTDQVLTYVSGDKASIGYISLGSLNDTVKAVKVDGAVATEENVINGSYPVKRPFNIVYKEGVNEQTKDFISFIMSKEGQDLAKESKVIAKEADAKPYEKTKDFTGSIRIQGSTSVTPYMEKLMEAYKKVQPQIKFDFTSNGSGAGITSTINDEADLGMASREIKKEELDQGLTAQAIALDGIAVVIHKENPTESLEMSQLKDIFTGAVTQWEELAK